MFLSLQKISKSYSLGTHNVQAVHEITVDINKNDFVCFTGASGSGKSTLLHIMGLLEPPSSGTVSFEGVAVPLHNSTACDEIRAQKVGFVFQQFHLLPMLTALENVSLALKISGISTHLARAQQTLERVGLGSKLHRYPAQLSGGEQQRVAFARAIAKKPVLLIADEPTANLDAENADQLIELLKEVHRSSNTTIVCASHTPSLIQASERTIEIIDGSIHSDSM